jgi:succinyl-diaminopimelate desuccinylase
LVSLEYELDFLSRLVAVKTESVPKTGYKECSELIVNEAEMNSLDWMIIDGEKGAKDGLTRPNVVVSLDVGSDVTLLLESHFDVVPPGSGWSYPPFRLTVEGDRAYGRGTSDNKAGIAAVMGAMRELSKEKLDVNLKLVAGVDEEIGGRYGVDYVMSDYGLKGDAALIVDAGPESLFLGASGIIWGKVTVQGKQGHAGYPFKAKNAINETIKLIDTFDDYKGMVEKKQSKLHSPVGSPKEFIWGRYSVTMINAGEKENVIPGTCEFRFDRRLLPEEPIGDAVKELTAFFQEALDKTGVDASLELVNRQQGYCTSADSVFVKTVSDAIKETTGKRLPLAAELGGNDGSFFAKNGIPVVCYGTIRADTRYHGIDEFVYLQDIQNTRDVVVNLGKMSRDKIATN